MNNNYVVSVKYIRKDPFNINTCDKYDVAILSEHSYGGLDSMITIDYIIHAVEHLMPICQWVVCEEDVITRIRKAVDKSNKLLRLQNIKYG